MPCGAENVHPVPLQGQGQDTARLCAVSDHADAVAAAHLCNLPIGQNLPRHIAGNGADHRLGVGTEQSLQTPDGLAVVLGDLQQAVRHLSGTDKRSDRAIDRVMLQVAEDHMVTRFQHTLNRHIQRMGAV